MAKGLAPGTRPLHEAVTAGTMGESASLAHADIDRNLLREQQCLLAKSIGRPADDMERDEQSR